MNPSCLRIIWGTPHMPLPKVNCFSIDPSLKILIVLFAGISDFDPPLSACQMSSLSAISAFLIRFVGRVN